MTTLEGDVPEDGYGHTFILTGKSETLSVRTAKPPGSPGNLGIVTTTCHSIQVAWDPPHDTGVDILGEFQTSVTIAVILIYVYV